MSVDIDLILKAVAPLLTLVVGAIVKERTAEKPRLIYHVAHAADHPLVNPDAQGGRRVVRTHSVVLRNAGKSLARNVRVGHMALPPSVRVWPAVSHEVQFTENGNKSGPAELVFPVVAPREVITISYLYGDDLTIAAVGHYIKSDEGIAQRVEAIANPPWNVWVTRSMWALLVVGGVTTAYWALRAFVWFLSIA